MSFWIDSIFEAVLAKLFEWNKLIAEKDFTRPQAYLFVLLRLKQERKP